MPTLHWLTKETDLRKGKQIPFRILEKKEELSVASVAKQTQEQQSSLGEIASDSLPASPRNVVIQGDNLEALKAILPVYAGKVKCIYIDPPYNTGNAFEHYDDNMEHTLWLSMIYPRLELLREFLSEDGSIWVSIDDDEAHYLKVIMDEIFGRKNFVATIIWNKRTTRENRRVFSFNHDFIMVFAKDKKSFEQSRNLLPLNETVKKRYKNPDDDPKGPWQSVSLNAQAGHATPNQFYEIISPTGKKINPPTGRCWLLTKERFEEEFKKGNIFFTKNGNGVPRVKKYLNDENIQGLTPETLWVAEEVGTNDSAKKNIIKLFQDGVEKLFETPKPEELIQRILQIATNPGDIVLDSFLGSGTTAAVALKMNRKFIGIEMGDHAVTHVVPRLRKVIEGEQGGISESVEWKGGGGFDFYTLGEPVFGTNGRINPKIDYSTLAAFIWFVETGTSLSLPYVGNGRDRSLHTAMIGTFNNTAYYLLYNGILGDKKPQNGNVLTSKVLQLLPAFEGRKIIYGESCLLGKDKLKDLNIIFKQIPYDLRGR
jgi:adenine-specific DNA-methyltransferase